MATGAFIGVGSNIEPAHNMIAAFRSLARQARVVAISMVYRTAPIGRPEQQHYFNCVAEIETDAPPAEVKHRILRPIENSLGRERTADKYAPRPIDLDLILYGDAVMETEDLRLPDPDILKRSFLAIPLFELAPELVLPEHGLRIGEIVARLPQDGMKPLQDYTRVLRRKLNLA